LVTFECLFANFIASRVGGDPEQYVPLIRRPPNGVEADYSISIAQVAKILGVGPESWGLLCASLEGDACHEDVSLGKTFITYQKKRGKNK
jgi:hypothetical protein